MSKFVWASVLVGSFLLVTGPATAAKDDDDGAYLVKHEQKQWAQPRSDKALVYIVRPANVGFVIKFWAFADDKFLGVTKGNNYTYAFVDPGERVFWSKAENVNAMKMNFEAGKTYYIQQRVRMGGIKARVKVELLGEEEGKKFLEECSYVTPTQRAATKAQEYIEKSYAKAKEAASKEK